MVIKIVEIILNILKIIWCFIMILLIYAVNVYFNNSLKKYLVIMIVGISFFIMLGTWIKEIFCNKENNKSEFDEYEDEFNKLFQTPVGNVIYDYNKKELKIFFEKIMKHKRVLILEDIDSILWKNNMNDLSLEDEDSIDIWTTVYKGKILSEKNEYTLDYNIYIEFRDKILFVKAKSHRIEDMS